MSRKSEFLSSSVVCFQCEIVSNRILVKECNVYQLFYCVFQSSSVTQIHEFQSLSVIRKKCIPVKNLCQVQISQTLTRIHFLTNSESNLLKKWIVVKI